MTKLNLKEDKITEEIQKLHCLYDKDKEEYKENKRTKTHGIKLSLLNEILNSYFI